MKKINIPDVLASRYSSPEMVEVWCPVCLGLDGASNLDLYNGNSKRIRCGYYPRGN